MSWAPPTSTFTNANWITGTGNSVYSGTLNNIGLVNAQNAFAGQTIGLASYTGTACCGSTSAIG